MDFFDVKADNIYLIRVNVKPNSITQEIIPCSEADSWLSIKLKSKPVKNKANKELLNLLKQRMKISSNQIRIVSGLKETNKILEIKFNENIEIQDIMQKLFK
jgi:uncharacterized protein (TIGR00251 family)